MSISPVTVNPLLPGPAAARGGGEQDAGQGGMLQSVGAALGQQQQTAGASAPEGGVSLFQGVLPKALMGAGLGATAGFVLPFGGPIMGGVIGAIAGAGWQVYKNYKNIKSIQEYNAALLAQSGVTPTSQQEVESLVSGSVPDQAVTEASVGSLVAQAAQQGGAATGQAPAGTTGATPGTGAGTQQQQAAAQPSAAELAAQQAQAEYDAVASQYRMVVTDRGSYMVHQSVQLPTNVSHTQADQYYAMLKAEHDKSVIALDKARQTAQAKLQAATGAGAGPASPEPVDQGPSSSSQPAVDPTGVNQNVGTDVPPPTMAGAGPSADATAGADAATKPGGGGVDLLDGAYLTTLKRRLQRLEQILEQMRAESEERRLAERDYWRRRAVLGS